jgi:hypothetical protein
MNIGHLDKVRALWAFQRPYMILGFQLGSFENMYLEKLKSKVKLGAEGS